MKCQGNSRGALGGGGRRSGMKEQRGETQATQATQATRASARRTARQGWARHQIVEHNQNQVFFIKDFDIKEGQA